MGEVRVLGCLRRIRLIMFSCEDFRALFSLGDLRIVLSKIIGYSDGWSAYLFSDSSLLCVGESLHATYLGPSRAKTIGCSVSVDVTMSTSRKY
jgi:hypothetical protein